MKSEFECKCSDVRQVLNTAETAITEIEASTDESDDKIIDRLKVFIDFITC